MSGCDRRDFLKTAAITAAAVGVTARPAAAEAPAAKGKAGHSGGPNLIYVFADQLGYSRCGYAGDEKARTPNLDAFAAQGVNFRQAVSNMPVCSAHRASLLTGKYPTTTGMVINELRMRTNHECVGHVLSRAGYQTGYIGKWHLYANQLGRHEDPKNSFVPPGPNRLGFDGYWAAYNFHHRYYNAYYHTDSPEKISYGEGAYEPDAQTDMAIGFLEKAAKADKPFALVLSYGTPHDPWAPSNVPPKYREMFQDVAFPNPRKSLPSWRRHYYAMTANLDWNLGRLLAAVRKVGLADNTILAFSSDHGEMFGAQGRRAKNTFYEEAARVPLLVRWPGRIPAGEVSDACISTVDIMPTLLSRAGLGVPKDAEGMDLAHCALGKKGAEPDAAFLQNTGACAAWEDGHEWRALRDKRYTYAIYRRDRSELLFDNVADPYQTKNLAGDPGHKPAMDRFRDMLAARMKSLNDTFETCTWYRDNWTRDRIILRGAKA